MQYFVIGALALVGLTQAQVSPLTPQTVRVGAPLQIQWTADMTNTWTNMTIDFMSGDNWNMITIENIATGVNGVTTTTYDWTVPDVNLYANVYFLQFTRNGDVSTAQWTTRFTIASAAGSTQAAPNSIQPGGETIPWGSGGLAGGAGASSTFADSSSVLPIVSSTTPVSSSMITSAPMSSASVVSSRDSAASSSSLTPNNVFGNNDQSSSAVINKIAGVGLCIALATGLILA